MTKISDIMTRNVQVVRPQDSLQQAAQFMKDCDIGSMPVCDGRKLLGMITDRDITVRAIAAGLSPKDTCVSDVMSHDLQWCSEDESADEVLRNMGEAQVRRIPVVNAKKELVGIVALGDLAVRDEEGAGEALREISEPTATTR